MYGSTLQWADKFIFINLYIVFHTMKATTSGQLHCFREVFLRSPFIAHSCCTVWSRVYLTSSLCHTRVLDDFRFFRACHPWRISAGVLRRLSLLSLCVPSESSKLGFTFYRVRNVYRRQTYEELISDKTLCG